MKFLDGLDLASQQLHHMADGSSSDDAASWGQVQALLNGLDWHPAVEAASTANLNLASPGSTIDTVAMSTGMRFLAKNQTTASQNGLYAFATSTTPATRVADMPAASQAQGAAVLVLGGTQEDTAWVVNSLTVVGTDAMSWVQFNAGGSTYSAGNGLTLTGSSFSVELDGDTLAVSGSGVKANLATNGGLQDSSGIEVKAGTGITVGSGGVATDPTVVVGKFSANVGDASSTDIEITHNLGTRDVVVSLRLAGSPYSAVITDWDATDTNNVTFHFASPPTSAQYRATIHG